MAKTARTPLFARRSSAKVVHTPPKRRKLSKRLEKAARAVKDSDEFVSHVAGLRDHYRREHALSETSARTAVRQATRTLHKHTTALAHWLQRSAVANTMEHEALDKLGDSSLRPLSPQVLDWLIRAGAAANDTTATSQRRTGNDTALLAAAEGLRAIFEHHKLKLSTSGKARQPAASVLLLCAIAREAGDEELPLEAAKAALRPRQAT